MVNLEKIRNYHAEGGMVKFDNADWNLVGIFITIYYSL
jgi:hypothetical protein